MNKVEKIFLKNGLRVILAHQPQSLTTTVLTLVEAGSKYETKEINGISHFFEHMCFKGTKKRPSPTGISMELDGLGSVYNAFTGMEYTGYFAKALSKHTGKILEIISDLYLNPVFDQKEIDKERGVIIEEINMYEDLPMRRVQEFFTFLLYGDQPAGWDIAGRKEVIQRLKREDFLNYRAKHYLASSTAIIVAGNFDKKKIVDLIQKNFVFLQNGRKKEKIKTREIQKKPAVLLKHKKSDQTHLVLGARAYDIFDKRKYALQVLSDILGGGMSSRLFDKIRGDLGAAYYVRAEVDLFTDHGYLAVSAGIDNSKLKQVIEAVLEEFKKLSEKTVGAKELQKTKNHLIGNLIVHQETSDELAGFYGGQEILVKKIITPAELIKKIQAVKAEEIMAVAKDIFRNQKLNLAAIGPFGTKEKGKIEKILKL